jgi:hypothetical protein
MLCKEGKDADLIGIKGDDTGFVLLNTKYLLLGSERIILPG